MPKQHCDHHFVADPWELQTLRCLYCDELFDDLMPLKLPPRAPTHTSLNSSLVRALRNLRLGG